MLSIITKFISFVLPCLSKKSKNHNNHSISTPNIDSTNTINSKIKVNLSTNLLA
jgi:hypothetical protein